jgi:elongation factor Ts
MATSPKTALIKELRARTSAPMKKCVDALAAADGDLDAAVDWLRKSGVATAHKKAGRGANEGAVVVASDEAGCVIVELNSETDFVARNGIFHELANTVARESLSFVRGGSAGRSGPYEIDQAALAALPLPQEGEGGGSVPASEAISMAVSQLGENLVLRRACALPIPAEGGVVTSYVHNAYAPGLGRTVAAVALRSQADPTALQALGTNLAMHIVAAAPRYLSRGEVDEEVLDRERSVLTEQAAASGKPAATIEKMVEGRLGKFYKEVALLEQEYIIEDKAGDVSKVLKKASADLGAEVTLEGFVRYHVGEEADKAESIH